MPPPFAEGDFDPVEYAEFLEADDGPLAVDPTFKERLRQRLWAMVRQKAAARARGPRRPPPPKRPD